MPGRLQRLRLTLWVGWAGCLLALLARWFPGDEWHWLGLVAYVPAPILGVLAAMLAIPATGPWSARLGAGGAALALGAVAFGFEQPNLLMPPRGEPATGRSIRVMMYNVQSYRGGVRRIAEVIERENPDILLLAEGTSRGRVPEELKARLGRRYHWTQMRHLAMASVMTPKDSRRLASTPDVRVMRAHFAPPDSEPFAIWLVDVDSPRWRDTGEAFSELRQRIEAEELPLLLAGDLNAPRQSRALARATRGMQDLFRRGEAPRWLATWPTVVPYWQIDHAFASPEFTAVRAGFAGDTRSDHHALVVEVIPPAKRNR